MLRNGLGAVAIVGIAIGFAAADEIKGHITQIHNGKVTVRIKAKEKGQKPEVQTFELAKDCKVSKKDKKTTLEVAGGLQAAELVNLPKKGAAATLITNADNHVTEIILHAHKKKKAAN